MGHEQQAISPVRVTRDASSLAPLATSSGAAQQRTSGGGNAARQDEVRLSQPPPSSPGDTPTPDERRYNIALQMPGLPRDACRGLSAVDALAALRRFRWMVDARLEGGFEAHQHLREIHDDQIVTATVSDLFGREELPSLDIWSPGIAALREVDAALAEGDVPGAAEALTRAAACVDTAYSRYDNYRDGTEVGANRAITVLEWTEMAGAMAAGAATGGLGSGGLLSMAAIAGATAGTYGAASATARQGSEITQGLRDEFDVGAILQRGGSDAINGFVGAFAGGALSQRLARGFGSYLGTASEETLAQLGRAYQLGGPMPRDFFFSRGDRMIVEFFSSVGTAPLTTAVSAFVDRMSGESRRAPTVEEFVRQVVLDMAQGGVVSLFMTFITHRHAGGPRPPEGPASGGRRRAPDATPEANRAPDATSEASHAPDAAPEASRASDEPSVVIDDPELAALVRPTTPEESAAVVRRRTPEEPSVVIDDPELAALVRPTTPEESAAVVRGRTPEPEAPRAAPVLAQPSSHAASRMILAEAGTWVEAVRRLQAQGEAGRASLHDLIGYRAWVVEQVRVRFEGEPAGTASVRPESDVDINLIGDNAAANLIEAQRFLDQEVQGPWRELLRMDLLIDNRRSTRYRDGFGAEPTARDRATIERVTDASETAALARMLRHATHEGTHPGAQIEALSRVEARMERLGLSREQVATIRARAEEGVRPERVEELRRETDSLQAQISASTDPEALSSLGERMTLLQIELNFHMSEAYVGPAAIRDTVQGQRLDPQEGYMAGISQVEMFDHVVAANHGDEVAAARSYEVFKYVVRYARTVEAVGIVTPESTFMRHLGEYLSLANRTANASEGPLLFRAGETAAEADGQRSAMVAQRGSGRDEGNEGHARGRAEQPYYVSDPLIASPGREGAPGESAVTDAQLESMLRAFHRFVDETLPELRARSRAPSPSHVGPPSP